MKRRPLAYLLISAGLLSVALALLLRSLWFAEASLMDYQSLWAEISWHDKFAFLSLIFAAVSSYQASRWLLVWTPIVLALLASHHSLWEHLSASLAFLDPRLAPYAAVFIFSPLAVPASWEPLKNPNIRWWRASRRYRRNISATLSPYVGETIFTTTYDISATGLFARLSQDSLAKCPPVGRRVRVNLCVEGMQSLRLEAEVVRICQGLGNYPRGVGLKIISFDYNQDRSYAQLLK